MSLADVITQCEQGSSDRSSTTKEEAGGPMLVWLCVTCVMVECASQGSVLDKTILPSVSIRKIPKLLILS
jgi:hypothetical protein